MSAPALQARQLSVRLGGAEVLHAMNLSLPAGRWTSLVGPNGAGKSTLLMALAGLLPGAGSVDLLGQPLAQWSARARAQQLCWLGQGGAADSAHADEMTAYDLAMLGRLPHQPWLTGPAPADHAAVEQALRSTQAWAWRGRRFGQLSGGERQRVLLARALAVQAQVLLMDEPLANLDPPHQADWLQLTRGLVASGKTVVSVLHEITLALHADDVVVMAAGRVLHHGGSNDTATHVALAAVFEQRIAIHNVAGQWAALPQLAPPIPPTNEGQR
ncbi:MAG: ABC transporter ATP-binding protein [Burkholderiaceae bacterium]